MDVQKNDVTAVSSAYDIMSPRWARTDAILGGTEAMRAAGETYLPRHAGEEEARFLERLGVNVLFNFTALTLNAWVGKPFAKQVQFTEDFSAELAEFMDDIDLQGNALDVFARNWFRLGVAKAFCHVLIDFPRINRVGRTAADDLRERIRPYWILVNPENVTFAETARIDGREYLTHLRIHEILTERDGWLETRTEQYRVLDRVNAAILSDGSIWDGTYELSENYTVEPRVRVQIYRQAVSVEGKKSRKKKDDWVVVETFYMDIDEIPLVTYYSDRTDLMEGKSPLLDQVDLNIRHWQSMSDQISVLTVARFPILAGSGVDQDTAENPQVIGPYRGLFTTDPGGKFYYVEHGGSAIAAGDKDLKNLEDQGKSYGAEYMKVRPSRETAEARALDSSEATSPLQDAVARFNDALQTAMYFTAKWLGVVLKGKAFLSTEFGSLDAADMQLLQGFRAQGDISRKQMLELLRQNGRLPEGFDIESNERELTIEVKTKEKTEKGKSDETTVQGQSSQ